MKRSFALEEIEMRAIRAIAGLVAILGVAFPARGQSTLPSPLEANLGKLPLAFVENAGQWGARARFVARRGGLTARVEPGALVLQVEGRDRAGRIRGAVVRLAFEGCSKNVRVTGEERQAGAYNYFLGRDPTRWRTGVRAYTSVLYRGLYEGVDLRVREGDGCVLEYDVLVAPGGDLDRVVVRCEGAEKLGLVAGGALVMETAAGNVHMKPPVCWQQGSDGEKTPIECRYRWLGGNRFTFEAPGRRPDRALVIDPGLVFSTYLGGSADDGGDAVALDAGSLVVAGTTFSTDFPTTPGAFDRSYNGGWGTDIFVARLSLGGDRLLFATYLGGSGAEWVGVDGLVIAPSGAITLAGTTWSADFPTTAGTYGQTLSGRSDGFVAQLWSSGGSLLFSTYLGGPMLDGISAVAVDASGAFIVAGSTESSSFPTTPGAFDRTYNGGAWDGFVARLSPGGRVLLYSTYLGGSGSDGPFHVVLEPTGSILVSGNSNSPDFPTTPGAFDRTHNGNADAFVVRLSPSGGSLTYGTYLGGSSNENGYSLAIDARGAITVVGDTNSTDFPTTPNAIDRTYNGGLSDVFVAVLSPGGGSLVHATYLGGIASDTVFALAVDPKGDATIAGPTFSPDFPFTPDAFDTTFNGGACDVFVARVSAGGTRLVYSTFLGGAGDDTAWAAALDGAGSVFVAGRTSSTDFPTTPGVLSRTLRGPSDAFVAKVAFIELTASGTGRPGSTMTLLLRAGIDAGLPYQVGTSLGTGPIPVDTRRLGLSPDPLLTVSLGGLWPSVFSGYRGVLDTKGEARAAIHIPNIPALIGVRLHSAFVTLSAASPSGVKSISNTISFTITK